MKLGKVVGTVVSTIKSPIFADRALLLVDLLEPDGRPSGGYLIALAGDDPWFTHWGGGWAQEWTETTEPVTPGTKTVASAGGVRSSLHRPPVALFAGSGRATETEGSVLAATVIWGGDTRFDAEMGMHRHCRLIAGIQHRGAARVLDPGERFPIARQKVDAASLQLFQDCLSSFAR